MSENIEEKVKPTFKEMTLAKRSKILFFLLNLALVVPFVVQNYSHWGLGGAALVMLIAFFAIVIRTGEDIPATRDIPRLLFFDVLAYLAVSYQGLIDNFLVGDLDYMISDMEGGSLTLFIAGLALGIFVPKKPSSVWLKGIGKTAIGAAIIMMFWSDGNLLDPKFHSGGDTFLAFYLLWAVVWNFFCVVAGRIDYGSIKRNGRLTNILLLILAAACFLEYNLIQGYIYGLKDMMLSIPTDWFVWWKVVLAVAVLLGCAVASYDYEKQTSGTDAVMLAILASAIILLKALLCNYFSFNWVIFAIFMVCSVRCLRNERNGMYTMRMSTPIYMGVQLLVLLGAVWMIKAGLWISVIIIAVYVYLFYSGIGKECTHKQELRWWITILSVPAVLAISYIWQMRFSMETVVLIGVFFVVMTAVMIILSWEHPDELTVPREYKILLCIFMAVLCLVAASRFGSTVDVEFNAADGSVHVEAEARGKENQVTSIVYSWSDITGEKTVEESVMSIYGTNIPIKGEKLTVVVTDANGVTTTKTAWYPHWLIEE